MRNLLLLFFVCVLPVFANAMNGAAFFGPTAGFLLGFVGLAWLVGLAADRAGIQFRLLNRRKGPAVQGPRAQADRKLYREAMQALLAGYPNLAILEMSVEDLIVSRGTIADRSGSGNRRR